jgi:mRNA interferase MazF
MKPGDIVLIRFPQADLKSGKLRPALIIAISPSCHRDLLLALISSRLHQATLGFDEIINTSDSDYVTTGLKMASLIRLGRLTSVELSVINARLGNISLIRIKNLLINWLRKSN